MTRHSIDYVGLATAILWLGFWVYWAVSAVGVKKPVAGKGSFQGWLLGRIALVAGIVFLYRTPVLAGFWNSAKTVSFFHNEVVRIAGLAVTALGIGLAVWARRHLGRNWSGRPTMKVDHELVTSGPYRFVRHPIYTGILTGLLGTALVSGPMVLLAVVAALCLFVWRIHKEEGYMMELFPEVYPAYRARTKALIPAVW